jgi:hypothetical protein
MLFLFEYLFKLYAPQVYKLIFFIYISDDNPSRSTTLNISTNVDDLETDFLNDNGKAKLYHFQPTENILNWYIFLPNGKRSW